MMQLVIMILQRSMLDLVRSPSLDLIVLEIAEVTKMKMVSVMEMRCQDVQMRKH